MLKKLCWALVLLYPLQALWADELKAGIAAIEQGHYSQAYAKLHPLANGGNAEAQYQLGEMLIFYPQPNHPVSEGVFWLNEAVVQQHYRAAISLSKMYLSGMGVRADMQKARHYLELAENFPQAPQEDCD